MTDDSFTAEAIEWRLRLRQDRTEAWEAFVVWLEGDPARSAAYDEVALAEADADAALAAMPPAAANDVDDVVADVTRWSRRGWIGGMAASAAAILIGIAAIPHLTGGDAPYTISTGSGERRLIALGGNSIMLNGDSRLTLHKGDARYASLDAGEAHFSIRHDAARPFELSVGGVQIRDLGTRFNVISDMSVIRVSVAEGQVLFDPNGDPVQLAAGQSLRQDQHRRRVAGVVDSGNVGAWRGGQLAYRDAPLADVASDLSRLLGMKIVAERGLADRQFTGVIRVDRDRAALFRRLGVLLDVDVRNTSHGWILAPLNSAGR